MAPLAHASVKVIRSFARTLVPDVTDRLQQLRVFRDFVANERTELARRAADGFQPELLETGLELGAAHRLQGGRVQLTNDVFGNSGRREQTVPARAVETREPGFVQCRDLRLQRGPRAARHRQHPY